MGKLTEEKYVVRFGDGPFILTEKGMAAAFSPRLTLRSWLILSVFGIVLFLLCSVAWARWAHWLPYLKSSQQHAGDQVNPVGAVPIGTIVAWHKNIGDGEMKLSREWLECEGQSIKRSEFPDLFSRFAEGIETIFLPDLNGKTPIRPEGAPSDWIWGSPLFLRGGLMSAKFQADEFKKHSHDVTDKGHTHKINNSHCGVAGQAMILGGGNSSECLHTVESERNTTGISIEFAGTTDETRPKNMSVVWIIRVR